VQDEQLLDAWRAGDETAGRELFRRHFDAVFWFFRNKIDAGAEDLAQDTFLALVRNKETVGRHGSFRGYLFTVARSKLIDAIRSRATGGVVDPLQSSVAELGLSPSAVIDGHRRQVQLLAALRRLPLELQMLLELRFFEQLSGPELAEVLGMPEGTVRTRLRRALELVRAHFGKPDEVAVPSDEDLQSWAAQLRGG
jgi:RNA polymerase sigma-70 factor (ECF subfamily)